MNKMIGKKYTISGMTIEIIADDGKNWKTRNITTRETVYLDKSVLQNAIRLGKAEEIAQSEHET